MAPALPGRGPDWAILRPVMRKLALFLALLLPLQFAWAGMATYCQHETTPAAARHVGHHEHLHADDQSSSKLGGDNDCGTCHAMGAAMAADLPAFGSTVPSSSTYASGDQRRLPDALVRAPDRPQWPRLA